MVVNSKVLIRHQPIWHMLDRKVDGERVSCGLGESGYDLRLAQDVHLRPWRRFILASSLDYFQMPNCLMGLVVNKSTWARLGVDASATTNIEPGWYGYLTIELYYKRWKPLTIYAGEGICQVQFFYLTDKAEYKGKYQFQGKNPQEAK